MPDDSAKGDPTRVNWTEAVELSGWSTVEGFPADQRITGYLTYDHRCLYVKLEHFCDGAHLRSTADIWSGDDWELFFAAQRGKPPYRQLGVNPRGEFSTFDWPDLVGKTQPRDWPVRARIVSRQQPDRWTVFVSIPLDNLIPGGAKEGTKLYANFFRGTRQPKQTSLAFSPIFDTKFHVLSRLAQISLE
jgi:hypothetical protein